AAELLELVAVELGHLLEPVLGHLDEEAALLLVPAEALPGHGDVGAADAQDAAVRDDAVGDASGVGVDDEVLELAELLALGVDDLGADGVLRGDELEAGGGGPGLAGLLRPWL